MTTHAKSFSSAIESYAINIPEAGQYLADICPDGTMRLYQLIKTLDGAWVPDESKEPIRALRARPTT